MHQQTTTPSTLSRLGNTIELLENSSRQLMSVMDQQIEAIIHSDAQTIEALSDIHTSMSWRYKGFEEDFLAELAEIFKTDSGKTKNMRLLDLKKIFPENESQIDEWHKSLKENASQMEEKHHQVVQLLEFAMQQNAKVMHALYAKHNEKNNHYIADGKSSPMMTGVAVNQEA